MKLLAVGDMHLGRRPSRLPSDLTHESSELGPVAAWGLTVDHAISEKVDAVLLAGDVVESEKDFFEGFGQLKQGVDKLTAASIQVIAVAGNHDVYVLPRLADLLEESSHFKLLGRGGKWEAHQITAKSEEVTIWGWSFPTQTVRNSPLAGNRFEQRSTLQIGLLHCDLDQSGSRYAPVSGKELRASGLDGWLLGHIHMPHDLQPDSLCGYLGCLSGMDPGEFGVRGPWMLHVEGGRIREVTQAPLAPLRWLRSELDISGLEDIEGLNSLLIKHTEQLDHDISAEAFPPKTVGMRLTLVGRSPLAGQFSRWMEETRGDFPCFTHLDTDYFVEHCTSAALPEIDLAELAHQQNPLGLLCKKLLLLDEPPESPERAELISLAKRRFEEALGSPTWRGLESNSEKLTEAEVTEELRQAGTRAINQLHAQQLGISE